MSGTSTGGGEPSRTLALLWGDASAGPRRKGPGRAVTVDHRGGRPHPPPHEQGRTAGSLRAIAERGGGGAGWV